MYTIRNYQDSDLPGIVSMVNSILEAENIPDRISEEIMRFQLDLPEVHPYEDILLAIDDQGELVGVSFAILNPRTGRANNNMMMLPQHRNPEIAVPMVTQADDHILRRGNAEVPAELPVYVLRQALDNQKDLIGLLESCGYEDVRSFYEMHIVFDGEIALPPFPPGIEMRPFDPKQHARAVHAAHQESFRDHWGHAEDTPYENWEQFLKSPTFDQTMWYIAWDGDEVAGISLCEVSQGEPDMGWVNILGVRRPYRKQGLGMALLRYSFHQFQQRGLAKGGLGVDAASKTNAVALYERAGMHVRKRAIAYRKVLRGNPADIVE
jgi:mycothiol synthase